jgi:hypothetical protein
MTYGVVLKARADDAQLIVNLTSEQDDFQDCVEIDPSQAADNWPQRESARGRDLPVNNIQTGLPDTGTVFELASSDAADAVDDGLARAAATKLRWPVWLAIGTAVAGGLILTRILRARK